MEKTKQNKHRGNFTPTGAGLWQDRWCKEERQRKRQETEKVKEKIFTITEIIKQRKYGEKKMGAAYLSFHKESRI